MNQLSDLQFMRDQARWPYWPRLPIKRRQGNDWPEIGCLIGSLTDKVEPVVYLSDFLQPLNEQTSKREYDSLEAVVADGWIVD